MNLEFLFFCFKFNKLSQLIKKSQNHLFFIFHSAQDNFIYYCWKTIAIIYYVNNQSAWFDMFLNLFQGIFLI